MGSKLHGYMLLVIAQKITPSTVWHYSTGNDDPVCERKHTGNGVGYIGTDDALKMKGVCYSCARYVGVHGDYLGFDSATGKRWLSVSNPKPADILLSVEHVPDEPVEWHIFNGEEWMVISYSGYAPVNHWDGEKWHEVKYRHRMHMCNAECTPVVVPETYALTVIRISGEEHIHRTGCGDIKRSKARAGIWAGEPWGIPVTSLREYTEIYWGDICTDQGPEGSPEYLRELYSLRNYGTWHACVPKLPEGDWSDVPA